MRRGSLFLAVAIAYSLQLGCITHRFRFDNTVIETQVRGGEIKLYLEAETQLEDILPQVAAAAGVKESTLLATSIGVTDPDVPIRRGPFCGTRCRRKKLACVQGVRAAEYLYKSDITGVFPAILIDPIDLNRTEVKKTVTTFLVDQNGTYYRPFEKELRMKAFAPKHGCPKSVGELVDVLESGGTSGSGSKVQVIPFWRSPGSVRIEPESETEEQREQKTETDHTALPCPDWLRIEADVGTARTVPVGMYDYRFQIPLEATANAVNLEDIDPKYFSGVSRSHARNGTEFHAFDVATVAAPGPESVACTAQNGSAGVLKWPLWGRQPGEGAEKLGNYFDSTVRGGETETPSVWNVSQTWEPIVCPSMKQRDRKTANWQEIANRQRLLHQRVDLQFAANAANWINERNSVFVFSAGNEGSRIQFLDEDSNNESCQGSRKTHSKEAPDLWSCCAYNDWTEQEVCLAGCELRKPNGKKIWDVYKKWKRGQLTCDPSRASAPPRAIVTTELVDDYPLQALVVGGATSGNLPFDGPTHSSNCGPGLGALAYWGPQPVGSRKENPRSAGEGTSFAAPTVANAVTSLMAAVPVNTLTAEQVVAILLWTAERPMAGEQWGQRVPAKTAAGDGRIGTPGSFAQLPAWNPRFGHGTIHGDRALECMKAQVGTGLRSYEHRSLIFDGEKFQGPKPALRMQVAGVESDGQTQRVTTAVDRGPCNGDSPETCVLEWRVPEGVRHSGGGIVQCGEVTELATHLFTVDPAGIPRKLQARARLASIVGDWGEVDLPGYPAGSGDPGETTKVPKPPRETKIPETPRDCEYTVRKGDTLWRLACRSYGRQPDSATDPACWLWPLIFWQSEKECGYVIGDPDLIFPGNRLSIPGPGLAEEESKRAKWCAAQHDYQRNERTSRWPECRSQD